VSPHSANSPVDRSFLTPAEVSELLRVSVCTVRRWINEGTLPAYKVGRGWRIREAELNGWLNQQRLFAAADNRPCNAKGCRQR